MSSTIPNIDILEGDLRRRGRILDILLSDKTIGKNIIWATDSYTKIGKNYFPKKQIKKELITGKKNRLIQPRAIKNKSEQLYRTKDKAEVFTPLRIVKQINDLADDAFRSSNDVNTADYWKKYVSSKRLEITCGEAPFIASRYNPTSNTGVLIKIVNRVGFLDRKLRTISRECQTEAEWLKWAEIAYKSSYGYEWQGDNLLLARENLLYTLQDFYYKKFDKNPKLSTLEHFADIIAWNIFQMDGLKYVIPMSCKHTEIIKEAPGLLKILGEEDVIREGECPGCKKNSPSSHNGKRVKIMNWDTNKSEYFYEIISN